MSKHTTFLGIILFPLFLLAKDYKVPTGSDAVTCTLSTLTQSAMLDIVGIDSKLTHMEAKDGETQKSFWEEFFNFSSRYMPVKVEINTKEAIKLKFDDYLLKTDDFLIGRRVFLLLYEHCILSKSTKRDHVRPMSIGAAFSIAGLCFLGATAALVNEPIPAIASGTAAAASFSVGTPLLVNGISIWYEQFPFLRQIKQMNSFLKDATYYYPQAYPAEKTFIPLTAQEVTIPANSTFSDIFFLDNKKIKRDIFTKLSPQLLFTLAS